MDLIGELPESQGYNAICVFVDRFSKMIHAVPTTTKLTAEGMALLYRDHIFNRHGVPRKFIHDRGTQFESRFMKELYRLLAIEANPSTAYHPQTDGQTERINQEIEQYLRMFINYHQSDWVSWLSLAEFSYNDKEQTSMGHSPFFVNYGRHPYKGVNTRREARNETAGEFVKRMEKVREETESALKRAAETMKRFYDRTRGKSHPYKVGDKVMLEATNLPVDRPMRKLSDKRVGPFVIEKKVGASAYKLKLPARWKIHPVFNEVLLTPYTDPRFESQRRPPPPPPDIVEGEEQWEVEEILKSRIHRGKLQFYVHWKGFAAHERTWEPAENLQQSQELIEEFYERNPRAARQLTWDSIQNLQFHPV